MPRSIPEGIRWPGLPRVSSVHLLCVERRRRFLFTFETTARCSRRLPSASFRSFSLKNALTRALSVLGRRPRSPSHYNALLLLLLLRRRDDVRRKRVRLGDMEQGEPEGANAMLEGKNLAGSRMETTTTTAEKSTRAVRNESLQKTIFYDISPGFCTCQEDQQCAQRRTQNKAEKQSSMHTAKKSSEAQNGKVAASHRARFEVCAWHKERAGPMRVGFGWIRLGRENRSG